MFPTPKLKHLYRTPRMPTWKQSANQEIGGRDQDLTVVERVRRPRRVFEIYGVCVRDNEDVLLNNISGESRRIK